MRRFLFVSFLFTIAVLTAFGSGGGHFDKAMALWDSGMWSAARVEFEKARAAIVDPADAMVLRCDYMVVMCAAAAGDDHTRYLAEDFLAHYPHTVYHNDVLFAQATELYRLGEWGEALPGLLSVDPFDLPEAKQPEYFFKLGHCYFLEGNGDAAYRALRQVDKQSEYGNAATYYIAYLDYTNGSYATAKQGFASLQSDPAYGKIVPFYLLQIEFLQNNFQYVTAHGDALLQTATKARAMETARLISESWYRLGDHTQALRYMDLYRQLGGEMGREENYIEGYCLYMTGDYASAAGPLGLVCTVEDALSQNAAYHLADCYLQAGDKRRAMQSFSIASAGRFDEAVREDALFNYGKLQYDLGGGVFNEAINVLTRYISEYPNSPRVNQAREYLLAAYYNSRNYEAAYEAIKLIPNPDNNVKSALQKITYFRALEYYNAGEQAEATRLLQISAANRYNAKYTALATFWQAEILYKQGNFKAAAPLYRDFITLSPKGEPEHNTAYYSLAYCYFNTKEHENAASWFERFLASGSVARDFSADTYNRLGDLKYAGRSFWQAIEEYDKAIKLGTQQAYYAEWRRAVMLGMVDRTPRKIESLLAIIGDGKGDYVDDAMYELGQTYMGQERWGDASAMLKRYMDTYPQGERRVDALADLGLVYQNLGRQDQALESYKQIVASAPNSTQAKDAMSGIRSIYVDRNDVDGYFAYAAKTGVETDLTIVQRDSLSFASAQRQYLVGADPKTGMAALQGYLKNYPKGAYRTQALSNLGDAAMQAGNRTVAKDAYKELAGMYYNEYTVGALEHLSRMQEEDKEYAPALASYRDLAARATTSAAINRGLEGMMRMGAQVPGTDMAVLADEVLASPHAGKEVIRRAQFAKATALAAAGQPGQAMSIYEKLASEYQTPEGAESAYRVIESLAAAGKYADAKKRIFAFTDSASPQTYWLGRSFLILGNVYIAEGDTFQARATFQSVVDGYPNQTDGIVEKARESIDNLK